MHIELRIKKSKGEIKIDSRAFLSGPTKNAAKYRESVSS